MKNYIYILTITCSVAFLSAQNNSPNALDWYGYNSMLSYDTYTNDGTIDQIDDDIFRKRRHRRRRKISPPKKGW